MKPEAFNSRIRSGYTLIELVMVIILVGIMFMVTAPLMVKIAEGWQIATVRTDWSESGMVAMDRMLREIRQAASVVTATSSPPVFSFVDTSGNTITYSFSGGYLMRNSNQLAANVSNLTFTYTTPADIKSIAISLTFGTGLTKFTLQSGVYPRRLQ